MTHAELVCIGANWLRGAMKCHATLTELDSCSGEIPDIIGWKFNYRSILIECKTSKSDFYADKSKPFRVKVEDGMGYWRYYLTPKGLLKPKDVEGTGWGILETSGKQVRILVRSKPFFKRNGRAEMSLLTKALRRVQFRINQPLHEVVAWSSCGTVVEIDYGTQTSIN
jgi:hypothetical protein